MELQILTASIQAMELVANTNIKDRELVVMITSIKLTSTYKGYGACADYKQYYYPGAGGDYNK